MIAMTDRTGKIWDRPMRPPIARMGDLMHSMSPVGAAMYVRTEAEEIAEMSRYANIHSPIQRYFLNYVLCGESTFIAANGERYQAGPGAIVQRFPHTYPQVEYAEKRYVECYFWVLEDVWNPMHQLGLIDVGKPVLQFGLDEEVLAHMNRVYDRIDDPHRYDWRDLLEVVCGLLFYIFKRANQSKEAAWIDVACNVLRENLHERMTLDDIAARLGMSTSTFRRDFKRLTGVSPGEYRIRRRIEEACKLLSDFDIKEVAYHLGYADAKVFSKQFRQFTGMTPSAYRSYRG